jgi:nucleoside-diphosphate-sugar epimerase
VPGDDTLTVAVTGATGTVGHGLLPELEADDRIGRVIAISSRPWVPDGYVKVEHHRVDVRDRAALGPALARADVVVHLAFALPGVRQSLGTLERINLGGTRNVLDAAREAGARRFVYTSSSAVYGFDGRRPDRVDEDAPVIPVQRHFYARQKAAAEPLVEQLTRQAGMESVMFRPCGVVGPHAIGAAAHGVPGPLSRALGATATIAGSAGLLPPVPAPPVPLQFVHERDVGRALALAVTGNATGRTYNLASDGMVEPAEVPSLLGLRRLPVPGPLARAAVATAAELPVPWPALGWAHLLRQPLELDTTRVRDELGWTPEFSSRDALAATRRALGL